MALVAAALATGATAPGAEAAGGTQGRPGRQEARLPLGPSDLPETRTTTRLQPGVTLTRISRGGADSSQAWTLAVLIPSSASSPDPDAPPRVLSDRSSAEAQVDRLRSEGFDARVEEVDQPATADVPAGILGYRVRVGRYATRAEAEQARVELAAKGESASAVYTGWDGDPTARGPWHVNVVRIDPRQFHGDLTASFGPDLEDRETTSAMARAADATVGVNGGFFVFDPASGAPGDPAGAGVYDGHLLSEPVDDRPALVLHDDARRTAVQRLRWAGSIRLGGHDLPLDGIDRVPGLIRNCGGDETDDPTMLPLHDTTCTDDSELVAFTRDFGPATPSGAGREVVLDAHGEVSAVSASRGTTLPPGHTSVQATGDLADELADVEVGDRLEVTTGLAGGDRPVPVDAGTTVVNGGPLLVRDGRVHVTQRRDGFVHDGDPSFAYGWVLKRNPRTFAGIDAQGRTVLVTVDGRSTEDLGLTVPEAADVARALGLVQAINLDGGGSTTMAVQGRTVSHPSDSTGERPVGDAVLVLPGAAGPG